MTSFASARFVAPQLDAAIVAIVTDDGRDRAAVDRILAARYGVRAWLFSDPEIIALISMLEAMAARLRSMPALKTIIRRAGGAPVRASVAEAQYELVREKARFVVTPELQATWGAGDVATAIADHVMQGGAAVSGFEVDGQPIRRVAISAEGRRVTVELGVEAASASIYLLDAAGRYVLASLDPAADGVRGSVTLPRGGTWRPDVIVLRDGAGVAAVRDVSEVGWQLEVE